MSRHNQLGPMRAMIKKWAFRWLFRSVEIPQTSLRAKAVVFAPHPDDDALGCGGLICHKRQAGADIDIVYMTDGRKSHSHLVDAKWLIGLRKEEATISASCLGVEADRLHFLGYEDSRLLSFSQAARISVEEILASVKPEQVVLPSRWEKHADHLATHAIVNEVLTNNGSSIEILEYPVWAWYSWPFIELVVRGRSEIPRGLLEGWMHLFRLAGDLSWGIRIGDMREKKQNAIAAHRSQMVRLVDDSRWGTLADVAKGEFLERLTAEREFYYRRSASGAAWGATRLGKISRRTA